MRPSELRAGEGADELARPPRVLHVVERLDKGSVETWLLRMATHAAHRGIPLDWTFYCAAPGAGEKDAQAAALGLRVVHSPEPRARKLAFMGALRAELDRGRYDVLHAHHDLVSGMYLAASLGAPVRRRIVHVHNADEDVLTASSLKIAMLRPTLRRTCLALADMIVANSRHTLAEFLKGRAPRPGRDRVHYLGIDASSFSEVPTDRATLRRKLGLPTNAPLLLFAGRMTPEKNPVFAVDVLAAIRAKLPAARGVFAGVGSLEAAVRQRAVELGQQESIQLLGWREDVSALMVASDWFILPHPETPVEGFGIAVVEAQLAGLRLLVSRGVLDDPLLPTAVVRRLSLEAPPHVWAEAAIEMWRDPAPARSRALEAHAVSPMDMDRSLDDLLSLYR